MFKKLLKYDFKSLKRVGLPMLVVVLISTVVISIFLAFVLRDEGFMERVEVFEIISIMFVVICACFIMFTPLVMQIMVYENFYKTLTTDEGYLTFTLPVKAREIIFAKLTNGIIWTLISSTAVALSALIIMVTGLIAGGGGGGATNPTPSDPISGIGVVNIILGILLGVVSYFATQLVYFIIIFCVKTFIF